MDAILETEDWEKHSGKYYQLEHELIKDLKGKDGLFFIVIMFDAIFYLFNAISEL